VVFAGAPARSGGEDGIGGGSDGGAGGAEDDLGESSSNDMLISTAPTGLERAGLDGAEAGAESGPSNDSCKGAPALLGEADGDGDSIAWKTSLHAGQRTC